MTESHNLLVIGGQQGLGLEITRLALGNKHWGEIVSTGHESMDVRDASSIKEKILQVVGESYVLPDIIYCAGVNQLGKIGSLDMESVANHFAVNVIGFINVLNVAHDLLGLRNQRVNITAIVSDSSRTPMRGSIAYASSKAALAHAIRCAARETAPHWRVNGVSPGIIENTPMTDYVDSIVPGLRGWTPSEARAYENSLIPMGRRATKGEVAQLVLDTTIGPEYMTGSIIDITGGK